MADVLIRVIGNTGSANRALAQTSRRVRGLQTATRRTAAPVRGLRTNIAGLSQTAGIAQSSIFQLTGSFILVGGLVLALRATSRAAIEFEAEMTKLQTLVGIQPELVEKWSGALRRMAPAVGVGPRELAKALFVVTSAGIRTGEALRIVELAAKASAIGLGDVASIARAVTSAMQAYAKSNLTAAEATDILVATVREGNLAADELASSLGRVLGIAAEVGVGFAELGGFIATFTRVGVTAEEAVTALRGILNTTLAPTKQARDALAEFGITIDDVRRAIREDGLARTLIDLVSILREDADALAAVFGNVRALSGILATAGAQAEEFDRIVQSVAESTGILSEGFVTVGDTAKQSMAEAKAAVEVLALSIGDTLLPLITETIQGWALMFTQVESVAAPLKLFLSQAKTQEDLARRINGLSRRRIDIEKELTAARGGLFISVKGEEINALKRQLEANRLATEFGIILLRNNALAIAQAAAIAPRARPNIFAPPDPIEFRDVVSEVTRELAVTFDIEVRARKIDFSKASSALASSIGEMMKSAAAIVEASIPASERFARAMADLQLAFATDAISTDQLRRAQEFLRTEYERSTQTFTQLAVSLAPAMANVIGQVIAAIRGQGGGGVLGVISGVLGGAAGIAALIPGAQPIAAGLLAGSIVSGALRNRPQPVFIDSFSQRAIDQQKTITGPTNVIVQVITPTGELLDEFLYEIGRRERTDNIRRFPTSTRKGTNAL